MKRLRNYLLIAFFCLTSLLPVGAQQKAALPAETIKQVEALIASERERLKIPGLSIAIAVNHQLVYAKGFGLADIEHNVAAKPETAYRTASIAKSLTATAVMQLAERGKLDLDAPIQKYCPAFPEKPWPITVRQLLGHLGGIRHYAKPGEASGTEHFFTLTDSLKIFKDDPLLSQPGTKFNYTTYGYSLLGCAIEGASGMTYEAYMQEYVFKPAGMPNTALDNAYVIIPNRARGYTRLSQSAYAQLPAEAKKLAKVGDLFNASLHDTSMKVPGGGLVSTAVDLVNFALAMDNAKLVKRETTQQMWTQQRTPDGKETGYGLGWGVIDADGKKMVSHSGGQAGTSTNLMLIPGQGLVIAIMCNLDGASPGPLTIKIRDLLLTLPGSSRTQ